jgi:tetratricopeptide (TPR) repeat protein
MVTRPKVVIACLAAIGLLARHAWLTATPLAAGDWHWPDRQRLLEYFPWPSVWDSTLGLGGENRFVQAFRYPVNFVSGLLASIGANWTLIEKVVYFVPFAVLLPVSGWLLAREIMGRTRWALLTPLLLLGSTYFLLEANGEIPLTLAEVVSVMALLTFIRTMRRRTLRWALATGLLVTLTAAYDIRPAYLVAVLMAMYVVILALCEHGWPLLRRRLLLAGIAAVTFLATQAFWLLPLLTYHGNAGFPTPQAPDFNIITLGHGLAGVDAFWSGGSPAQLVQAPLNPAFMIMPLLAMAPLLARRIRPEVLWLAVAALCFAFLAKTNNPPFGGLYDWMYIHVPGWKFFREGSKFLYIVALAYSILIPIALAAAFRWASRLGNRRRLFARAGAALALAGVAALSVSSIGVLQTGALGSTTTPTPEPSSFSALSDMLARDPNPGSVLWMGQPLVDLGARNHHFLIASPLHPAVNLTGSFSSTKINQRDPYQLYCADNLIPFCYLDSQLFPYLTNVTGAGYVVAPGSDSLAGTLPNGVTRAWLDQRLTSIFGAPTRLGDSATELLVWRTSPAPAVTSSDTVALVESGTWSTPSVLPALQALGVPAAYQQSFDSVHYPPASASLPDSVGVIPRSDGGCLSTRAVTAAVMVRATSPSVSLSVAGAAQTLLLLNTPAQAPGWGMYGPIQLSAGAVPISSAGATPATVGPCVAWSPLTVAALAGHDQTSTAVVVRSNGEQLQASPAGGSTRWVELRRYYDPGWQLGGAKPTSLGDGLFNLYHVDAAQLAKAHLTFTYSTVPFERIGQGIAGVSLVVAVLLLVFDIRRRRVVAVVDEATEESFGPSRIAHWLAIAGLALLAVTAVAVTIEWFGVPSQFPMTSFASDPYSVDVGYGGLAVALLLLSATVRVVAHLVTSRRASGTGRTVSATAGAGIAAIISLLLLSACGASPTDLQSLLSEAQQAGSVPPSIQGASLDDARLQRAARKAGLCIADYTTALTDFPNLVRAYVGRGDCYINGGGNGAAAIHDYSRAIGLSPDSADLYLRRAVAYRVVGDTTSAIADYRHAAAIPAATDNQDLTAIDGLVALDEAADAQAVYAQAIAREPTSALLHLGYADLAINSGNDTLADQELATAEHLASGGAETAIVLSHVCHRDVLRGAYDRAVADCTASAQASSGGSGAYDDLAAAQLALGNATLALSAMNSSIDAFLANAGPYAQESGVDGFGLSSLYAARAWIEVQLHSNNDAIHDFETALQVVPAAAGPNTRARLKAYIATAKADAR